MKGKRFTLQTTPAGAWDGIIRCQVLDVYRTNVACAWKGGHESNVGYGSRPDTVVTSFTLSKVVDGTRVRVVHSGRRQER